MAFSITLTMRDLQRHKIIGESLGGHLTVAEASQILGLSERQVYRIRAHVKVRGAAGVVHGLRGRSSFRKIPDTVIKQICQLYIGKYQGFNISHFTEHLCEREGITISHEKVRQVLRKDGLYKKRPKGQPGHRIRREPMSREGMMSQFDTSYHAWLPGSKKKINFICIVDDATNKIQYGCFFRCDTTRANLHVLTVCVTRYGLMHAVYVDRDSKFRTTREDGAEYEDTQIERALKELGITLIHAYSPQAKGRIERDFGTLQDRLISELRLHDIRSISGANKYFTGHFLPDWNIRFARCSREPGLSYRPLPEGLDLRDVLCIKSHRRVYLDNTVSYRKERFQLLRDSNRSNYGRCEVEVYDHPDGQISILFQGRKLRYTKYPLRVKPVNKNLDKMLLKTTY